MLSFFSTYNMCKDNICSLQQQLQTIIHKLLSKFQIFREGLWEKDVIVSMRVFSGFSFDGYHDTTVY